MKKNEKKYIYYFLFIYFLLTFILFLFYPLKETITCKDFECNIKAYSIFNSRTDLYLLNSKGKQKLHIEQLRNYSPIQLLPISKVGYSETQIGLFKEQLINNQGELLEFKHTERLGLIIAMFSYFSIMCIIFKFCIGKNKTLTRIFYSVIILIFLRVLYILLI